MAERTDWKGLHAEAVAKINRIEQELSTATTTLENQQALIDEHENTIAELRKQINLARIQGMNEVTSLLLREVG